MNEGLENDCFVFRPYFALPHFPKFRYYKGMDAQEIAKDIVKKLVDAGHIAYFAGGWVRDFLMGHPSDDIDIATDASPDQILQLFPKTFHVGIAFGVVVVCHDGHQFEVATFRKDIGYEDGRKPTSIEPSTAEEDAKRRDFTINGMFYDPLDESIHDFVGGREDLSREIIRTIGDPFERFFEDRLRMIRALRFACRFGFHIDTETQQAIADHADTLFPAVSMERIWQEFSKMAAYPAFDYTLVEMHRLGLLSVIFPGLKGVHLDDIKHRVSHFHDMPKETLTIAYFLQLFPDIDQEGIKDLCRYLRTSNRDQKFAQFLHHIKTLESPDTHAWSHIYAHPDSELCIKILAASEPAETRSEYLAAHQQRHAGLAPHIKRIIDQVPVVTSEDLKNEGIKPGKLMGELLKESERIAILYEFHEKHEVLDKLKESQLWKDAHE